MHIQTIYWQAITPIHAGAGQNSSGVLDLPIARESATNYPVIPATSIKGVLRDGVGISNKDDRDDLGEEINRARRIFGHAGKNKSNEDISAAGSLTLTDVRILCLPVRSYIGTFALMTCPLVLQRLTRDQEALGIPKTIQEIPKVLGKEVIITSRSQVEYKHQVILEDIDLDVSKTSGDAFAQALSDGIFSTTNDYFLERFVIVSNDVFSYFCQTAMEVIARIRMKEDTKTVADGGLWYEEAIPAETLFSSFAISKTDSLEGLQEHKHIQVGGHGSVGRGLLSIRGVL
jgi:CRISPR-associated protein Cmr4